MAGLLLALEFAWEWYESSATYFTAGKDKFPQKGFNQKISTEGRKWAR